MDHTKTKQPYNNVQKWQAADGPNKGFGGSRQEGGRLGVRQMKEICDKTAQRDGGNSGWTENNDDGVSEDASVFFVGYLKTRQVIE